MFHIDGYPVLKKKKPPVYKRSGYKSIVKQELKKKVKMEIKNQEPVAETIKDTISIQAHPQGNKRKYLVKFINSFRQDYKCVTERLSLEEVLAEVSRMFADTYDYHVYEDGRKVHTNRKLAAYGDKLNTTRVKDMRTKFIYDNIDHCVEGTGLCKGHILNETRIKGGKLFQFVDEKGNITNVHRRNNSLK